jgi:phosphoenolpyruvate carboxykinase (ATP)
MLTDLIASLGADCWLANTGWTGRGYGTGQRMSIRHTRELLRLALDGTLARGAFRRDPFFGLLVPDAVPGVPAEVLDPRQSWADKAAYDRTARELMGRFGRCSRSSAFRRPQCERGEQGGPVSLWLDLSIFPVALPISRWRRRGS